MKKNDRFEDKLKRLELIVESLDSGEISIEEMIVLYEEGIKLVKQCRQFLEQAEQKIIEVTQSASQEMIDED